jgi:hypothetical protein
MKKDVDECVALCDTCQRVKTEHIQPARMLPPLQAPEQKWEESWYGFCCGAELNSPFTKLDMSVHGLDVFTCPMTVYVHLVSQGMTTIKFITDGVLIREIMEDPLLIICNSTTLLYIFLKKISLYIEPIFILPASPLPSQSLPAQNELGDQPTTVRHLLSRSRVPPPRTHASKPCQARRPCP